MPVSAKFIDPIRPLECQPGRFQSATGLEQEQTAQTTFGAVLGTITDPSGGGVTNARLTLTDLGINQTQKNPVRKRIAQECDQRSPVIRSGDRETRRQALRETRSRLNALTCKCTRREPE